MAIFEEKTPRLRTCLIFLFFICVFSYPVWHLGERELFWSEGDYAAAAMEQTGFPPVMRTHGIVTSHIYPLYPLFVKAVSRCGLSMESSLRIVSLLAFAATAVLVFIAGLRTGGLQSAAAGTTIMLTTFLTGEKAVEGYPQILTMLILFGGWMAWFELTLGRVHWNLAWLSAGLFGALAFYSAGATGLIYFILPLLAQQRPLNVWNKMRYSGFVIGIALIVFAILLWRIPLWNHADFLLMREDFSSWRFTDFLKNLVMFPADALFRFFPWSLMIWAPFCAALIPLDPNPLFGKYNRVLFTVLFVLIWLNPATRSRDFLYLAPLVSVMIGSCYWIVIRRYGQRFLLLFHALGWCLLLCAVAAAVYMLMPDELLTKFVTFRHSLAYRRVPAVFIGTMLEIMLSALLAAAAIYGARRKAPVWMVYALVFCSAMTLFWSIVNRYRACDKSKSTLGREFREALEIKENLTGRHLPVIYKDYSISGLYPECCYMGVRVMTVDPAKEFAPDRETVYVISTGVPTVFERNWTRIHDQIYKDKRLYLYKGVLRKDEYDDTGDE